MKKYYKAGVLGLVISVMMTMTAWAGTGPAYPEVPAGERTSNLAENQNFADVRVLHAQAAANEQQIYFDMYGNPLRNARLAGGEISTNNEGVAVWNGITIDGNYSSLLTELMTSDYGWKQDPEKPINDNGVSNWYYKGNSTFPAICSWRWLSDEDNPFSTRKAYCFNEYGYLYVNTITPDGFIVNERGQMITEDGLLIEHEINASTHDPSSNAYVGASIGKMRETYFTVCNKPICGGRCFTGEIEKENPNRISVVGHQAPEAP